MDGSAPTLQPYRARSRPWAQCAASPPPAEIGYRCAHANTGVSPPAAAPCAPRVSAPAGTVGRSNPMLALHRHGALSSMGPLPARRLAGSRALAFISSARDRRHVGGRIPANAELGIKLEACLRIMVASPVIDVYAVPAPSMRKFRLVFPPMVSAISAGVTQRLAVAQSAQQPARRCDRHTAEDLAA